MYAAIAGKMVDVLFELEIEMQYQVSSILYLVCIRDTGYSRCFVQLHRAPLCVSRLPFPLFLLV